MIGFKQEFTGKRINARIASRDGGTYMMTDRRDKVVTVIEVKR